MATRPRNGSLRKARIGSIPPSLVTNPPTACVLPTRPRVLVWYILHSSCFSFKPSEMETNSTKDYYMKLRGKCISYKETSKSRIHHSAKVTKGSFIKMVITIKTTYHSSRQDRALQSHLQDKFIPQLTCDAVAKCAAKLLAQCSPYFHKDTSVSI